MIKKRTLINSFNNAFRGLIYAIRTQRNMKIHIAVSVLVLIISLFADLNRIEFAIILILIGIVIAAEIINTSIEITIDSVISEIDPVARTAKDLAAAGVLICAVMAIIVANLILVDKLNPITLKLLMRIKNEPVHLTYIALLLVFVISVVIKALTGHERSITRGGMPSVHSAIAFASATAIAFITKNAFAATLAIIMALLVSETRFEMGVHTGLEIAVGAILGMLITILIFQLAG